MANPFIGCNFISRGDLRRMVQSAIANEPKERERLRNAQNEFYKRTSGVTDTKRRILIFKEVAEKYGYREEYFITTIHI